MREGIRQFVGASRFDQYREGAAASMFAMQRIGDMNRDELLALVGWMQWHHDASTHPGNLMRRRPDGLSGEKLGNVNPAAAGGAGHNAVAGGKSRSHRDGDAESAPASPDRPFLERGT